MAETPNPDVPEPTGEQFAEPGGECPPASQVTPPVSGPDAQLAPGPADLLAMGLQQDTATPRDQSSGTTPDSPDPSAQLRSSDNIAAEFPQLEILHPIGRGGMGSVFLARQPGLDRLVALKILDDRFASQPEFRERFAREARALARLSHPGIVTVYDFGISSTGRCHLLMEYIEGANLRTVLQAGRLTPATALDLVPRICDALQYAHDEGVVHRDIKPENILVDRRGRPRIVDFGLAKLATPALPEQTPPDQTAVPQPTRLTASGMAMGTPHYMAPEQIEQPLQVDHRADVYALGVVLYEMLTGELPLGRFAPPSERAPMDPRLDPVVMKALERQPDRRYQKVSEVATDLTGISVERVPPQAGQPNPQPAGFPFSGQAPRAGSGSMPTHGPHGIRRGDGEWPWPALLGLGLAIVSTLLAAAGFFGTSGPTPQGNSQVQVSRTIPMVIPILLVLGLILPPVLGFRTLRRLRQTPGTLQGAGLAIGAILFYPAIVLIGVWAYVWKYLFAVASGLGYHGNFLRAISEPAWGRVSDASLITAMLGIFCGVSIMWYLGALWLKSIQRSLSERRDGDHPQGLEPVGRSEHFGRYGPENDAQAGAPVPSGYSTHTPRQMEAIRAAEELEKLGPEQPDPRTRSFQGDIALGLALLGPLLLLYILRFIFDIAGNLGESPARVGILVGLLAYGVFGAYAAVVVRQLARRVDSSRGVETAIVGAMILPGLLVALVAGPVWHYGLAVLGAAGFRPILEAIWQPSWSRANEAWLVVWGLSLATGGLVAWSVGRRWLRAVDPIVATQHRRRELEAVVAGKMPFSLWRGILRVGLVLIVLGSLAVAYQSWMKGRLVPDSSSQVGGLQRIVLAQTPKSRPPMHSVGFALVRSVDSVTTGVLVQSRQTGVLSMGYGLSALGRQGQISIKFQYHGDKQTDGEDSYIVTLEYAPRGQVNGSQYTASSFATAQYRDRPVQVLNSEHGQLWLMPLADLDSTQSLHNAINGTTGGLP